MDSNMEKLDCVAKDILTAANIDMEALKMLSREELRDLFPGPDHFLRRKSIWDLCHPVEKASCSSSAAFIEVSNGTEFAATGTSSEGGDSKEEEKSGGTTYRTLTLPSPQYVIYTDSELENVKSYFFQLKRLGRGAECELSKELTCRLIRNTITNMMSAVRALHCEEKQYPSKEDLVAMAKRLVIYYPMLSDKLDIQRPWIEVFKRLQKRIHNVRSPKKSQGGTPARGKRKLQYLDADDTDDSTTSTILLSASSSSTPSTPEVHTSPATLPEVHSPSTSTPVKAAAVGHDSRMAQARHYRHLQEICRKNKQNQDDVSQLLDLEFEGRRQFIDSETLKEADRPGKILEAYSCFKNIDHVLEELRRIVAKDNVHYVKELKERWADYRTKLSFYGVYKKVLKPPVGLPADEQAIDLIISLADMFPSGYPAPKKMSSPSEALIHVLQPTEAPDVYLRRRPLATPFILVGEEDCFLCAGNAPVVSFEGLFCSAVAVISVERYIVVCYPMGAVLFQTRHAVAGVVLSWVWSFVWNTPPLFGWGSYDLEGVKISCAPNWYSRDAANMSYMIIYFSLCFAVPFSAIMVSYSKLLWTLHKVTKLQTSESRRTYHVERQVARMVVVMVLAFLVTWLPYAAMALAVIMDPSLYVDPVIATIPVYLAKSSTVYNPIIYIFMNRQFRGCVVPVVLCGWSPWPAEAQISDAATTVASVHKNSKVVEEPPS